MYKNRPLIVSYVGYTSYEERISTIQQFEVQIALQPAVVSLDEIIVMPGKELLVDQAIDRVLVEYQDQEEMLIDFYTALFVLDQDHAVLNKLMKIYPLED